VPRPAFIGPEADAAAFRLAGIRVLVDNGRDLDELLAEARRTASLVIVSASAAAAMTPAALDEALRDGSPPVALVPEMMGPGVPPDLEHDVRAALGVL
jgi:vacuolar-type H+-ATPase subunit F/Vma7